MNKAAPTSTVQDFIEEIRVKLDMPLPGVKAQNKLSPVADHAKYRVAPKDHRVACVMALIHPQEGKFNLTFIERASIHPDDKHAGQIGFPGGKMEDSDKDHLSCALREVEEEIGIAADQINVLGALTDLYVFASNFMVYPYVGYIDLEPSFVAQESEVASIISFPLDGLMSADALSHKDMTVRGHQMKNVPYYTLNNHTLWGATAMITSELLAVIASVKK